MVLDPEQPLRFEELHENDPNESIEPIDSDSTDVQAEVDESKRFGLENSRSLIKTFVVSLDLWN